MLRFSLRQIFIAVVALAVGFSIWRLPKGSWIDIPVTALSVYFVLSLCRHAAASRRLLIAHPALPRQQRWGGRILIVELLGAAMALVVALVFRYLAAAELLLVPREGNSLIDIDLPALPRDLAVLAMLLATALGSWQSSPATIASPRQKVYGAIAAAATLIAVISYFADRMLTWFLIYVALSGVESAQPPHLLPPEMNVSTAVRIHRFTVCSLAGLACVVTNLLFVAGLVKWWHKAFRRLILLISLVVSLAAECWFADWIAMRGLKQLSSPLQEAIQVPPVAAIVVVVSMIFPAVGVFTWRVLAKPAPVDHSAPVAERTLFFHENSLGCLLLGAIAMTQLVGSVIEALNSPYPVDWRTLVYYLTFWPGQFIWIAATIGGFALAWSRWHRRKQRLDDILPCVNPALFIVMMGSLLIVLLASAPILAAVSFSFWLVQS